MWRVWLVLMLAGARALVCFNCSSAETGAGGSCAGRFHSPAAEFNASAHAHVNCSGENTMCFTRSWRSRSAPAWVVQRGCARALRPGPLLPALTPTDNCKLTRLADAEYEVCLCAADWCNAARRARPGALAQILALYILLLHE